jgi:hypothetical protein
MWNMTARSPEREFSLSVALIGIRKTRFIVSLVPIRRVLVFIILIFVELFVILGVINSLFIVIVIVIVLFIFHCLLFGLSAKLADSVLHFQGVIDGHFLGSDLNLLTNPIIFLWFLTSELMESSSFRRLKGFFISNDTLGLRSDSSGAL